MATPEGAEEKRWRLLCLFNINCSDVWALFHPTGSFCWECWECWACGRWHWELGWCPQSLWGDYRYWQAKICEYYGDEKVLFNHFSFLKFVWMSFQGRLGSSNQATFQWRPFCLKRAIRLAHNKQCNNAIISHQTLGNTNLSNARWYNYIAWSIFSVNMQTVAMYWQ